MDTVSSIDEQWMRRALSLARQAAQEGEGPVGAGVVDDQGREVAAAANAVEKSLDGTAHAELLALQQASRTLGEWRLTRCTLYVTKEPCPMCAGAIVNCRVGRLVFGAADPRMGAAGGALDITGFPGGLHCTPVTSGVLAQECAQELKDFFRRRRGEERPPSHQENSPLA